MMITQAISAVCELPATTLSVKIEGRDGAGVMRGGREETSGCDAAPADNTALLAPVGAAASRCALRASTAARTDSARSSWVANGATALIFLGFRSPVR